MQRKDTYLMWEDNWINVLERKKISQTTGVKLLVIYNHESDERELSNFYIFFPKEMSIVISYALEITGTC